MKTIATCLLVLVFCLSANAQVNLELVSQFQPDSVEFNDLWGYTAPDGTEYALMSSNQGFHIVSLADPAQPFLVETIGSAHYTDVKTWANRAYVMPAGGHDMLIVKLENLPEVEYHSTSLVTKAHNIWIDEYGFAYLSYSNLDWGVAILDVATNPDVPEYIGLIPFAAHDMYARNNLLYGASNGAQGFYIYDVADKSAPELLTSQPVFTGYSHSVCLSDDAQTLFFAAETTYAPISSFDISDFDDITLLDEWRMPIRPGLESVPHNVFYKNGYLVITHYVDGLLLVDAHEPDNLVTVGQYDTDERACASGFRGAFGVYPYFPSGNIIVSDMQDGLFVLRPDFQRACYLEGTVTDASTGLPLFGVSLKSGGEDAISEVSNLSGKYRTGRLAPGPVELVLRRDGFYEKTITANLQPGELTAFSAELQPLVFPDRGQVLEQKTQLPLADLTVLIESDTLSFLRTTGADGHFDFPAEITLDYTVQATQWGWTQGGLVGSKQEPGAPLLLEIERGYEDNFSFDFGWEVVSSDSMYGQWEQGVPMDSSRAICQLQPPLNDAPDFGKKCFVTGNSPIIAWTDFGPTNDFCQDVANGTTELVSPLMALRATFIKPLLSYSTWFHTSGLYYYFFEDPPFGWHVGYGTSPLDDTLHVLLTNGPDTITLEAITDNHDWQRSDTFDLREIIELTDEMRLIFRIGDTEESPNFLEAAVDHLLVIEGEVPEPPIEPEVPGFAVFPNPFFGETTVEYRFDPAPGNAKLLVFNALGQLVESQRLTGEMGELPLGWNYPAGLYFLVFEVDGKRPETRRVVKGS